jgi:uncharacterized protein (TIGR02145 family)
MSNGDLSTWKNTGQSWFFGIGINTYAEFPNLTNAVRDVETILELLVETYDINSECVYTLFNEEATEENIVEKLDFFAKNVKSNDKLIIYYSGHGRVNQDINTGYWIPSDAKKSSSSRYILNSTIQDYVGGIDAKHILLISDSCFSGTLFMRGAFRSTYVAEQLEERQSRWAICSGRHDEEVFDGEPGGHSPFASSLINYLKQNTEDLLPVSLVAHHVIEETASNYRQLPDGRPMFGVGHGGGQYVFRKKNAIDKDVKIKPIAQQVHNKKQAEDNDALKQSSSQASSNNLSDEAAIKIMKWIAITVLGAFIIVGGIIVGSILLGGDNSDNANQHATGVHQVKDADGETYPTVTIGKMEWMARNLNYVSDQDTDWAFLHEDELSESKGLGLLYSYQGAVTACSKLTGGNWTLPTFEDWNELAMYYGHPLIKLNNGSALGFSNEFASMLVSGGITNLNLQLGGKYLIDLKEFSPDSFDKLNSGHYWIFGQRILNINRHDSEYTAEITSRIPWNHACSCRCVKRN